MSNQTDTRKFSIKGFHEIEWTISKRELGQSDESPKRRIAVSQDGRHSEWFLRYNPNSIRFQEDPEGWIGLYLVRAGACTSPQSVNFRFGLKKRNGKVFGIKPRLSIVFDKQTSAGGYRKWIKRRKLDAIKFSSGEYVTIVCLIQVDPELSKHFTRIDRLSQDFTDMFLLRKGCDVLLRVQNEEIPAHKFILAARSPVFAAMFEADMKENNTGVVDVVDCYPEAFKNFLLYMYSGTFECSSSDMFELYAIAHKYDVEMLTLSCRDTIVENLTIENVTDAFAFGHCFSDDELITECQDFFDNNIAKVFSSVQWHSFSKQETTLANELLKKLVENNEITKKRRTS